MLFIYFHVMSIVRVHPRRSRDLIGAYEDSASIIDGTIGQLSPLVTQAMNLLERPIRPQDDPMAKLFDTVVDLRNGSDDLAWRLELIENGDSRSMGEHTVLNISYANAWIDGDLTLIEALVAAGLTEEQAKEAQKAINRGDEFAKAVADQWSHNHDDLIALEDLNQRIDNWSGTDNDPIFDQMLRERRELEARIADGEENSNPNWRQAVSDQQRVQSATTVVVEGDDRQTYIYGLQEDEFWERMANSGNDIDAVLATIDRDGALGLLRWEPDSVWMTTEDSEEMLRLRDQLGLNENETLFITADGTKFVRVNPGPNEVFVPASDWAVRRFLGEDPSVTVFGSDDEIRYQPLDNESWLVSTGNQPPILIPVSAIPDHIIADHFGDSETTARRRADFEDSLGGTLVAVSDGLIEYATSPRGAAELITSVPGIDTFGDIGWCAFDGTKWAFTDGNGVDTGLSCAAVVIPGASRTVLHAASEGGEAVIRSADDVTEIIDDIDLPPNPRGFETPLEFEQFGDELYEGLDDAGFDDATAIFQGSSVTGESFRTGEAFDVGRTSDFDVALSGSDLLERAEELGIGLRSGGTRTGPLEYEELAELGLDELADSLSEQAGREVNFMIFENATDAINRSPSIVVPR